MTPLWAIISGGTVALIALAVLYHLALQQPDDGLQEIIDQTQRVTEENERLRRALETVKFNSSNVSTIHRIASDALEGK
jgi:hypothetical protein